MGATSSALPRHDLPCTSALPRHDALPRPSVRPSGSTSGLSTTAKEEEEEKTEIVEEHGDDVESGAALPHPSRHLYVKRVDSSNEDKTEQGEAEAAAQGIQLLSSVTKQNKSLAEEYTRLGLQFESALIQHKLALEYFDFRAYYFVFLPVTLIATSITIIGFLITGNTQDDNNNANSDDGSVEPILTGRSTQILSLVVGILGAISTLLISIGKRRNYQSQSDMHRSAVNALEKICLSVEFEREWFERKVLDLDIENAGCDDDKNLAKKVGAADLKTYQASFKAMLDACCDSPVPYEVSQAFTLLEQIFCLEALEQGDSFIPLMYHYHKLWKEYSTYQLWPLKAPSIKVSKKNRRMGERKANFFDDEDEQSMWSCCCWGNIH